MPPIVVPHAMSRPSSQAADLFWVARKVVNPWAFTHSTGVCLWGYSQSLTTFAQGKLWTDDLPCGTRQTELVRRDAPRACGLDFCRGVARIGMHLRRTGGGAQGFHYGQFMPGRYRSRRIGK